MPSDLLLPAIAVGLTAAVVLISIWYASRTRRRRVEQLGRALQRLARGDDAAADALGGDMATLAAKLRVLSRTRERLTSILSSMNEAVWVTDARGRIEFANNRSAALLGYSATDLVGRDIASLVDDAERQGFSLDPGRPRTETVLVTKTAQKLPVSISMARIDTERDPGWVVVASDISEQKKAEKRVRYLARYDSLTRIPNRMQFQHLLQQAIARARRSRTSVALLYLDMDRFKEVNDTFGHEAGDRSLETATERLIKALPGETVKGRLAGDEFAVFLEGLPQRDNRPQLADVARLTLDEIARPFYLYHHELYLTASVGIAVYPQDAKNVIDLIRNADAAMYHAKQNGGNTFAFYSPEMNAAAVERLMLKSKLRRALERKELVIHYQPKVDLRDGTVVGAEALLRWRLPGHGDIPPAQFIPLAEESSLIVDIGDWVLSRVCLDYKGWQERIPSPGRIAINFSLRQLRQQGVLTRIRKIFREHGVSPTCLELEITETTLMEDPRRSVKLLDELYGMGLHLSIDDFGTGYSSLSALQHFPISTLKIDQSFVRDAAIDRDDAAIIRTIIEMGRSLGMEVVAEGVESEEQLAFLRSVGCTYAQGRLFGEPMTADELLALLAANQTGSDDLHRLFPPQRARSRAKSDLRRQ